VHVRGSHDIANGARRIAVHEHKIAAQGDDGRLDDINAIPRARDPHAQFGSAGLGRELRKENADDRHENVDESDQRDGSGYAAHDTSSGSAQHAAISR